MAEKMVKANGVDICTEAFGDPSDPAILLVMGATASMLRWDEELCQRLASSGRFVIRYDNRDTGRSTAYDPGTVPYSCEDLADDAVGVLDAYGIDKAHIIGASMGGMITQQVALRHRDRVLTITPIMSTPDPSGLAGAITGTKDEAALPMPSEEFMSKLMGAMLIDWTDEDAVIQGGTEMQVALVGTKYPADVDAARDLTIAEMKRASSYRSAQNHALAVAQTPRWRERLAGLDVPTLVIHGTADPILPFPHGEALAKDIPGAKFLPLDGVGHEVPKQVEQMVVDAIVEHTS